MDDYSLLIDLHKRARRLGPGGDAETSQAMALANLKNSGPLRIADIGCGTGAATLQLARALDAEITAVDFLPDFIDALKDNAAAAGVSEKTHPLVCPMEELPFAEKEFDVVWSEGAIYNMGFENGVTEWRRFLKPGGILAVSEITWITNTRPQQIQQYWQTEYPEIATASAKIEVLEQSGYSPIAYFALPEKCWLENYYAPLQQGFADFLKRNADDERAPSIVAAEKKEIALYETYKSYYSYGMYIARRLD